MKEFGQCFFFDDEQKIAIKAEEAVDDSAVKEGPTLLFYHKTNKLIVDNCNKEKDWADKKKNMSNILPPNMLHVGDNCFANVIFQSLAFMDFEEETMHYMRTSDI